MTNKSLMNILLLISLFSFTLSAETILIGTLKAKQEAVLKVPTTGGILDKIHAKENSYVKKGQILAEFQNEISKDKLTQESITLKNKLAHFNRTKILYKLGDTTKSNLEDAESAYMQAKQSYLSAVTNLSKLQIKAPFEGELGLFRAELGAHLDPNLDLVTLYDTSEYIIYFHVTEHLKSKIKLNQKIKIKNHTAQIYAIENRLDPKTQLCFVKAKLSKCDQCVINQSLEIRI